MSRGAAIPVGAVLGLALGIVVAVTADVPLAPEAGLLLGAWAAGSGAGRTREDLCAVVSGAGGEQPTTRPGLATPQDDEQGRSVRPLLDAWSGQLVPDRRGRNPPAEPLPTYRGQW
jgi:hypothetical protein